MKPPRHHRGVDPGLVGPRAYSHPAVRAWWDWLASGFKPSNPVALVIPCSNVKPYTRSPTSRKVRGLLRRMGLWNDDRDSPGCLDWLYFSDLLGLVPYEKAEEYPACCYELPPTEALRVDGVESLLARPVCSVIARYRLIILFLPKLHLSLWERITHHCEGGLPAVVRVPYTVFKLDGLREAVSRACSQASPG